MANILQDDRVKWLRQRVLLALELPAECFDEYFTETLERARAAGIAKEMLASYLSGTYGTGSALFFSSKKWEEQIEGNFS